jgi:hypothetical protein
MSWIKRALAAGFLCFCLSSIALQKPIPSMSTGAAMGMAIAATPMNTRVPTPTPIPGTIGLPPPPPTRPPPPTPRPSPTPLGSGQPFLPVADAYVRAGAFADTNYGADPTLVVKDGSNDYDRRTFFRFDLRTVATTHVRRAILKLYVQNLPNGSPAPFRGAAIADDTWSEARITWNTQPTLGSSGMLYSVTATGWFSLDLTGYVNTQLAGDKLVSLAVFDDTAAGRMIRISSKEGNHPPVLEITP